MGKETSFTWLHLTDLHWGLGKSKELWPEVSKALADDIVKLHNSMKIEHFDAIFFTGDIVQKGDAEEFSAFTERMRKLKTRISEGLGKPFNPYFFAIPGNHDLERPKTDSSNPIARGFVDHWETDESIRDAVWRADKTSPYYTLVQDAFKNYIDWWPTFDVFKKPAIKLGALPGDFSYSLNLNGHNVGIVGLNSAFLQLGSGDYQGKLELNRLQLQAVCGTEYEWLGKQQTNFLLTHHPNDWLSNVGKEAYERMITPNRFAYHLCGHMHENHSLVYQENGAGTPTRSFQASSLMGLEKYQVFQHGNESEEMDRSHGFCAGRLNFKGGEISARIWPRKIDLKQKGNLRFVVDGALETYEDESGSSDGGMKEICVGNYNPDDVLNVTDEASSLPPSNITEQTDSDQKLFETINTNIWDLLNHKDLEVLVEALSSQIKTTHKQSLTGRAITEFLVNLIKTEAADALEMLRLAVNDSFRRCRDGVHESLVWNDARDILGWLLLGVVRNDWAKMHVPDDDGNLAVDIRVRLNHACTQEVAVARRNLKPARFRFDKENRPIGENAHYPPAIGAVHVDPKDEAGKIILEIWNNVRKNNFRTEVLSTEEEFATLNITIRTRARSGELNYVIINGKSYDDGECADKEVFDFVFEKLPNLQRLIVQIPDEQNVIAINEEELLVQIEEFYNIQPGQTNAKN